MNPTNSQSLVSYQLNPRNEGNVMFKSAEQVEVFVNLVEKFALAVINKHSSSDVEDVLALNKRRDELEAFIKVVAGINAAADTTDTLICPDCGADMALRTNRQNGNKFWGCKKYPNCKGTRDENGLSKAEREEEKYKKEQAVQEGGFSFNRDKRNVVTEVSPPVQTGWVNPFAK